MAINPILDFLTCQVSRYDQALLVWDVDLALQDTMCTKTTPEQRNNMWELYERTNGGVIIFTGRSAQSARETFNRDYAGVFEHYSVSRFVHGTPSTPMGHKLDIPQAASLARQGLVEKADLRIAPTPDEIRGKLDKAVYIEAKETSIALVHTIDGSDDHLYAMRDILVPLANNIVLSMGAEKTHKVTAGKDAVEITSRGLSPDHEAHLHLSQTEIKRIVNDGLSKSVAVHNFSAIFNNRRMLITGDSTPDLQAMQVAKESYNGMGVFVSNGHSPKEYAPYIDYTIPHFSMTWPLIGDTVERLRDSASITKIMPSNVSDVMCPKRPMQ